MNIQTVHTVCDDCLTAVYDEWGDNIATRALGPPSLAEQERICIDLGADIPDHICERTEDLTQECACACQYRWIDRGRFIQEVPRKLRVAKAELLNLQPHLTLRGVSK